MKEYNHILLKKVFAKDKNYKAAIPVIQKTIPIKDRNSQSDLLSQAYDKALKAFNSKHKELATKNIQTTDGIYLDFQLNAEGLNIESFDSIRGAKLMNIKEDEVNNELLHSTLFIPKDNHLWFTKKLEEYANPQKDRTNTKGEKIPRNSRLVNSVEQIEAITLKSFFTIKNEFESLPQGYTLPFELWIDKFNFDKADVIRRITDQKIKCSNQILEFENIAVFLILANKEQIEQLIYCIDYLSEIRRYKQPSILSRTETHKEEKEWIELIKENIQKTEDTNVRIGILDSGINNGHELLKDFLPDERCHSVIGTNKRDLAQHGTGMAGLVMYGDLSDMIYERKPVTINHELTSIKIYPGPNESSNNPELYGVITEAAIKKSQEQDTDILCMAITAPEETMGDASSWSSAIDETLYEQGNSKGLLLVSAGNIIETDGTQYIDWNINNSIEDPAQSWNAITVGAYTEKCIICDPAYTDKQIIAAKGELSPFSRTSCLWGKSCIKPEILMEGGNAYQENNRLCYHDDLSLITTNSQIDIHSFDCFNATSAATALATNLAAQIKYQNPELSSLSIRALMIHSAEWTEEMKKQATDAGRLNKDMLLHACGYGIPIKKKALNSNDSYVTFIVENEIKPLERGKSGSVKFANMHYYDLPWPKEILIAMRNSTVKMKITLSYYIQPAPGKKAWKNKHRYQSLGLRFDVNTATEKESEFITRISRLQQEDEESTLSTQNDTSRWGIGIQRRNQGCIHSDWIEVPAVQLSTCNKLAIFPVSGWWKEKRDKVDCSIKYSLIVSLETPEVEIYSTIKELIDIPTSIPIEV